MLWKNELTEIRNENAEQISGMNGAMWDQLSPTVEYLSSFSIPMFEEEVIKKDLIGMAKEAEIEQISLEEKLGMPPKEFCDNLIENGEERTGKRKVEEQILELAVNFVLYLLAFWFIEALLDAEPGKLYASDMLFAFFAALSDVWLPGKRIMAWDKRKEYLRHLIKIGSLVLVVFTDVWTDLAITGNGFVIGGCMILASVMAVLIRRNYWKKQSQKYDWK